MIENIILKHIRKTFLLFFILGFSLNMYSQQDSSQIHEITLYVMPTLKPLNWESPAKLYRSMMDCYLKTILIKHNYLLGHIAVRLNSPLIGGTKIMAQTSSGLKEKRQLIFKEKAGMAIMGAALHGRIEPQQELERNLKIYAKRNKLAIIKYRISGKAMERILLFIKQYSEKKADNQASSDFYSGAFWPRYLHEGGGCSAFGLSLLDLINVKSQSMDEWSINVNIPMELIGGEFNQHKKIKRSSILKTQSWYDKEGTANVDYIKYFIYDPSKMFDWIMKKRKDNDSVYQSFNDKNIPGLYVDARDISFDENEPLFLSRPEPNLFIDVYFKQRKIASITKSQQN